MENSSAVVLYAQVPDTDKIRICATCGYTCDEVRTDDSSAVVLYAQVPNIEQINVCAACGYTYTYEE